MQKTLAAALDDIGRGAFILAAEAGAAALSSVLATATGTVFDSAVLDKLIELLYDMPDDIANQLCNSFAFDCHRGFPGDMSCVDAKGNPIKDVDSNNWSSAPGPGWAVSPDNIHMFWDAPGSSDVDMINGLYGYNVPAQLCVGVFNKPKCALVPSTGTATIVGRVFYKDESLEGSYVSAGCQTTITPGEDLQYMLIVRSGGQYKVIARYEDRLRNVTLYGEGVTGLPGDPPILPKSTVTVNIGLTDPPDCMRNVVIQGIIRCDDVYLTGSDSDQKSFSKTLFVQGGVAIFNIGKGSWDVNPTAGQTTDNAEEGFSVGDSNAKLKMSVSISSNDLSVYVTLTGILNPDDENMSWGPSVFHVLKDQTISLTDGELDTGGPFNDRAYFRGITIANNGTPAI